MPLLCSATHVEFEDGSKVILSGRNANQRKAIARRLLAPPSSHALAANPAMMGTNKKVYRHLINGDVLLLNRQPTLHKPSIMAHKVCVSIVCVHLNLCAVYMYCSPLFIPQSIPTGTCSTW